MAPDAEVLARAQRRQFTADYKRRIRAEADSTKQSGAIGDCSDARAFAPRTSPTGVSNAIKVWLPVSAAPSPGATLSSMRFAN
ncbi:MAG: hypothetical protein ABIZ80_24980 [Bryobacteraceae bacterium]